jgi:hypothetical protein
MPEFEFQGDIHDIKTVFIRGWKCAVFKPQKENTVGRALEINASVWPSTV